MSRRRWTLLSFVAVAALLAGVQLARATASIELLTQGNTKIGVRKWHNNLLPIVWRFHDPDTFAACAYSSTNAPVPTLQPANAAGFQSWQDDPDSRIAFTYGGTTATRSIGNDGVNVVTFCDAAVLAAEQGFLASTPSTALTVTFNVVAGGGCPAGQGILDINGPSPPAGYCFPVGNYPPGTIIDADIRYNTFSTHEDTDFSTNNTTQTADIQATATHEIGHFFGLSHDPIWQAVMYPFVDDEPQSDALGQRVLKRTDYSTSGRYYPEASFGTNFGSITGFISLDGIDADGVHVVAIDPTTMIGVAGRFSLSRFEDTAALGPEGPDFTGNGAGFYRIDGLPPGQYYVYAEYFTDTDWFTARMVNRYNTTIGNSNVSNGNEGATGQVGGWLGFLPALAEFYDTGETANGGNGANGGTATDNSDAASLVTVSAGAVTSNINIAINLEPPGDAPADRENPTARVVLPNDLLSGTDELSAYTLETGNDDYWAIRYPAGSLPAPPFNVAEGQWIRAGMALQPMTTTLTFADPNNPLQPDLAHPVVASAGRVLSGGPGGVTASGDFIDVRDQWNVTIPTARDVWIVINQPPPPDPNSTFITEGFFAVAAQLAGGGARVNNTLLTINGGAAWLPFTEADIMYDAILEIGAPVMVLNTIPNTLEEGQSAQIDIIGVGFESGATASFGPGITVNNCSFSSPQHLLCDITVQSTGATLPREVDVKLTNPRVIFPTVGRVFNVTPLLDADLDGVRDSDDCAPLDNTLKTPAGPVMNIAVTVAGGPTVVSWDSQEASAGTGTGYDVVTGLAGDLRLNAGYASAVCGASLLADTPFADLNPDVGVGEIRYWILRARNACNTGPGTYGDSTETPDPRDVLDAGTPCP
ncbi:MAG: matrixin family metalloprotease [Candidatus Polarisedimenticolia bacterium]